MSQLKGEHSTLQAYVIGFLLSLVFTFIPYYLVVNQIVIGTPLLVTILAFGVLQMLVQLIFFLHLGRNPKPTWQILFLIATVGTILVVVGGSIVITRNLHHGMAPSDQTKSLIDGEAIYQIDGEKTGACHGQHDNHQIVIKDGNVSPSHTDAQLCDTLSFINEDDVARRITFGEHDDHGAYAGENELILPKDRSKTITLSESGTYQFHDHLEYKTAGEFTVAE